MHMSTFVCSDIHGQYELYKKMLDVIGFNEHDHLYILGDIIDRGPDSLKMLQDVISRKNATCLLGNHELMMYMFIMYGEMDYWMSRANGGNKTYELLMNLTPKERKQILKFIHNMPLQVELEVNGITFLLSHSFFLRNRKTKKWKDTDIGIVSDVVWSSPWRAWEYVDPETYKNDGREHIIGHYPVQGINSGHWENGIPAMPHVFRDAECRITNIDTGCARLSTAEENEKKLYALCCLELDRFIEGDSAYRYIQPD